MSGTDDIVFDFQVQVGGKKDGLDIEDATTVWDETEVPFVNVARITIRAPQKEITTPMHVERCENLVFTPWHSLAEHQPLGSINRLRRAVYLASRDKRDGGRPGRGVSATHTGKAY